MSKLDHSNQAQMDDIEADLFAKKHGITLDFINPSIPTRNFDWAAYRDPEGRTGYGATKAVALRELLVWEKA